MNLFQPLEPRSCILLRSPIIIEKNHNPTKTSHGPLRESRALRVLPFEKASRGVFYSSTGSGATVGYQY
jgi:hypothetical protein